MAICTLRFDFRNPEFAQTTMAERYQAALEMSEWAERLGQFETGGAVRVFLGYVDDHSRKIDIC